MQLSGDAIERILGSWPVARLATQGPRGLPAQVPVVFARWQGRLWSPVDGKPKSGGELARLRNVRARPGVSLLIDHYDADWRRLWWLRVDGVADVIRRSAGDADAELAGVAGALREKYPQYRETPLFSGDPTLLAIRPTRMLSWSASQDATGRTRF